MNLPPTPLKRAARFPGLRALAWSEHHLYASRGYDLLRARVEDARNITWQPVAHFRPSLRRRLSVTNRLTARLFRDGFHALALLPSGAIIGGVPSSIVTLGPGESEFRQTHAITRGTRPLHITATPDGALFWGEYFDNAQRDEVHIYGSQDAGATWSIAYTFAKGAIRHVHNIGHDPWGNCFGFSPATMATNAASFGPPAISPASRLSCRVTSRLERWPQFPQKTLSTFLPIRR
jgi:hypothetical protein